MADTMAEALDHGGLLLRCAAGDRSALRALYEAEAPRMKAVARRILRREEIAEEAVQDAFLRIWRKAGQYDPARGTALGWIYTVQRSVALNILRDSSRENPAPPEDMEAHLDLRAEIETAEDIWGRLDAGSRLKACLDRLEPARRKVLILAYAFGLSHGEIAGRLAHPLGTVKAWVRRSLSALRECMG